MKELELEVLNENHGISTELYQTLETFPVKIVPHKWFEDVDYYYIDELKYQNSIIASAPQLLRSSKRKMVGLTLYDFNDHHNQPNKFQWLLMGNDPRLKITKLIHEMKLYSKDKQKKILNYAFSFNSEIVKYFNSITRHNKICFFIASSNSYLPKNLCLGFVRNMKFKYPGDILFINSHKAASKSEREAAVRSIKFKNDGEATISNKIIKSWLNPENYGKPINVKDLHKNSGGRWFMAPDLHVIENLEIFNTLIDENYKIIYLDDSISNYGITARSAFVKLNQCGIKSENIYGLCLFKESTANNQSTNQSIREDIMFTKDKPNKIKFQKRGSEKGNTVSLQIGIPKAEDCLPTASDIIEELVRVEESGEFDKPLSITVKTSNDKATFVHAAKQLGRKLSSKTLNNSQIVLWLNRK